MLNIRRSRDADVPAITTIYAFYVDTGTATFETVAPDEVEMQRRRRLLIERRYPYFVAEIDGEVCGYAYAGPYRTRSAYYCTVENSVYVKTSAQRRGIGKALLHTLIQACTDQGFHQMVAIIGDSAHIASIRLHRAVGFQIVGTLQNVGHKHGRWLDTVLMQLSLNDTSTARPKPLTDDRP